MNEDKARTSSSFDASELFFEYKKHPTEAQRNELVVKYLHIARIIALRFSSKGVDFDDLYQVASMALIKAVERFDPEYGVKFQTYATPKMVGEVKNHFRDKLHMLNLPRRGVLMARQLENARGELAQKLKRSPTLPELIVYTGLEESTVIEALALGNAMYPASLDVEPDEDGASIGRFIGADDREYDRFELQSSLNSIIDTLTEQDQRIIKARYWQELSQREIALELGVSQMTVSRAERKALSAIREKMMLEEDDR